MKTNVMRYGVAKKVNSKKGLSIMEIVLWMLVFAVVAGLVGKVFKPKIDAFLLKNTLSGEFNAIDQGLSAYYENNYKYPSGSGWGWNESDAYVPSSVINKGWQYSCSNSTITLTTPPIANPKVRTQLVDAFRGRADSTGIQGNSIALTLNDRPCN